MNFYKHYIGDFQRDTGHLSLTERGAYLCLIHHYYATEKPLPDDHAALCRIAGAITKTERDSVRAVMSFFTVVDSGLMHARIEAEIQKAGELSTTNRDIAVAREAKRRAEKLAKQENEHSTLRAPDVPRNEHELSTHQTPDTINRKETCASDESRVTDLPAKKAERERVTAELFAELWAAYPRKRAKDEALKAFARRKPDRELLAAMLAALAKQSASEDWQRDEGKFIPYPATWINGGRWLDDDQARVVDDRFAGAI